MEDFIFGVAAHIASREDDSRAKTLFPIVPPLFGAYPVEDGE